MMERRKKAAACMRGSTHIGAMRAVYASNQRAIRAAIGWSMEDYNNLVLELGMAYLEERFPPDDAPSAGYYEQIVGDKKYWSWWRLEWKRREAEILRFMPAEYMSVNLYINNMYVLLTDDLVSKSFDCNYLYHFKLN